MHVFDDDIDISVISIKSEETENKDYKKFIKLLNQ